MISRWWHHTFGKFIDEVVSNLLELAGVDGEDFLQLSDFIEKILRDIRLGA